MERSDLICTCGCRYNRHWTYENPQSNGEMCLGTPFGNSWDSHCTRFKLDNLKYLEMLSKEREVANL